MGLAERKFRRNSSWRATLLPTASLQVGWARENGQASEREFQKRERDRVCAKEERVTKVRTRGREDVSGRISSYSSDRGRTGRDPLALLAYRYFGTRVRLRLTTSAVVRVAAPPPTLSTSSSLVLDVLDKKPPTARTRNAKSARDVSIDSVTADL